MWLPDEKTSIGIFDSSSKSSTVSPKPPAAFSMLTIVKSIRCRSMTPSRASTRARRPGARREILETYVKRLEKLEHIADGFKGVQKAFAVQAGRELRIIVEATRLTDDEALWLSRDVAKKIESELQYPGQIKVTVIRETRAVEYAR